MTLGKFLFDLKELTIDGRPMMREDLAIIMAAYIFKHPEDKDMDAVLNYWLGMHRHD